VISGPGFEVQRLGLDLSLSSKPIGLVGQHMIFLDGQLQLHILYRRQQISLYLYFYALVRSNGATLEFQKSKMAADGHLGYTKMAITSQPVCRSTWCLVLGWGFRLSLDFQGPSYTHSRVTLGFRVTQSTGATDGRADGIAVAYTRYSILLYRGIGLCTLYEIRRKKTST